MLKRESEHRFHMITMNYRLPNKTAKNRLHNSNPEDRIHKNLISKCFELDIYNKITNPSLEKTYIGVIGHMSQICSY